jgi:hypothetical protein
MIGMSKILTVKGLTNFLVGTGAEGKAYRSTRRTAIMLGAIATHLMRDVEKSGGTDKDYEELRRVVSLVSPIEEEMQDEE